MIKVFFLVIAYTLEDGSMQLVVQDAEDHCPTVADVALNLQPLKESGYLKDWKVWCKEAYIVTQKGKGA